MHDVPAAQGKHQRLWTYWSKAETPRFEREVLARECAQGKSDACAKLEAPRQ